jgi:hypothetical protein
MSDLKLCLSSAQAALAMAPHWTPEYALERYTRELRNRNRFKSGGRRIAL